MYSDAKLQPPLLGNWVLMSRRAWPGPAPRAAEEGAPSRAGHATLDAHTAWSGWGRRPGSAAASKVAQVDGSRRLATPSSVGGVGAGSRRPASALPGPRRTAVPGVSHGGQGGSHPPIMSPVRAGVGDRARGMGPPEVYSAWPLPDDGGGRQPTAGSSPSGSATREKPSRSRQHPPRGPGALDEGDGEEGQARGGGAAVDTAVEGARPRRPARQHLDNKGASSDRPATAPSSREVYGAGEGLVVGPAGWELPEGGVNAPIPGTHPHGVLRCSLSFSRLPHPPLHSDTVTDLWHVHLLQPLSRLLEHVFAVRSTVAGPHLDPPPPPFRRFSTSNPYRYMLTLSFLSFPTPMLPPLGVCVRE